MSKEIGKNELKTLLVMATNWYKSDISKCDCDGTEQFVLDDYWEKITDWMLPYVSRMIDIKAITKEEANEFVGKIWKLRERMRVVLGLPEPTDDDRADVIALDKRRISFP